MRRPGHRVCTCGTGVGSSIQCYTMQYEAMDAASAARKQNPALDLVVMRCRAGCDHWHVYSKDYLAQLEHMESTV